MLLSKYSFILLLQFIVNKVLEISSLELNLADQLIPNDSKAFNHNTFVINNAFDEIKKAGAGKLIVPQNTYYVNGGIRGPNLANIIIQIDGTLRFQNNRNL